MSVDHFDIVLVEGFKLQRGNRLEGGQVLKFSYWVVQPLLKLNHRGALYRIILPGLAAVFRASFQFHLNIGGPCVQIIAQADLAQCKWNSLHPGAYSTQCGVLISKHL